MKGVRHIQQRYDGRQKCLLYDRGQKSEEQYGHAYMEQRICQMVAIRGAPPQEIVYHEADGLYGPEEFTLRLSAELRKMVPEDIGYIPEAFDRGVHHHVRVIVEYEFVLERI